MWPILMLPMISSDGKEFDVDLTDEEWDKPLYRVLTDEEVAQIGGQLQAYIRRPRRRAALSARHRERRDNRL